MTKKMTVEQMRAAVEAHDAEVAAKRAADQAAYLQPLVDVVETDAFKDIAQKLAALAPQYKDDFHIAAHLNGLASIMPNLAAELARQANDPGA